jgi:hypothetical protein
MVIGDFNIAPDDRDVYDPDAWRGRNLCSGPERQCIRGLLDCGLTDLGRAGNPGPGPYTFWDYRQGAFHRGWAVPARHPVRRTRMSATTAPCCRTNTGLRSSSAISGMSSTMALTRCSSSAKAATSSGGDCRYPVSSR